MPPSETAPTVLSGPAEFFATSPHGVSEILAAELATCGVTDVTVEPGGVAFRGTLADAYRACLWSRTASRVLMVLARFPAPTPEALYEGVRTVRWNDHMGPDQTLAVTFTTLRSAINHTNYGALKTKDAIVDQFRDRLGRRPSVDPHTPDLRVNVHVRDDAAVVNIDLSGESLHRRGVRSAAGPAPLKENLAAALLLLAEWPAVFADGGVLVDPMCGAGTFLIEAGFMRARVAPGLLRAFGFERWRGHDAALWRDLVRAAAAQDERRALATAAAATPLIVGHDRDPAAVQMARRNLAAAGLDRFIRVDQRDLSAVSAPPGGDRGIVVTNPPYGARMGDVDAAKLLLHDLGNALKRHFTGYTAHILAGSVELAKYVGLRPTRRHVVFNGPIECRFLTIPIHAGSPDAPAADAPAADAPAATPPTPVGAPAITGPATAFANRLEKNLARLKRWLEASGVSCFRLYDKDLPEYAVTVERFERHVVLREHEAPASVDPVKATRRLADAVAATRAVLQVAPDDLFVKRRRRQRGAAQYVKLDTTGDFREVREGGLVFLVNLRDYFDTGLFLDHRDVRAYLRDLAAGRDFLNLFAYTGSASVYAAAGSARSTTTVDLSQTYLDWAAANLARNGFPANRHHLLRSDCLRFVRQERRRYGLIFLDPPTFSNSKAMVDTLDIQRDHVALIRDTARLLTPDGVLIFSTNATKFRLDEAGLGDLRIRDITRATLPPDFARTPRIHQVFHLERP